jgi:ATP-dependent Lon protease
MKTVLIPQENEKDLAEIPDNVKSGLNIVAVEKIDEVLKRALVRYPEAITWDEEAEEAAARAARKVEDAGEAMTAH